MLGAAHVIWRHLPEDLNPQQNCCDNLKCGDILHVEDTIHLRHDTVSQDNGILTFSRNVMPSSPRFSKSRLILEECIAFRMLESDTTSYPGRMYSTAAPLSKRQTSDPLWH